MLRVTLQFRAPDYEGSQEVVTLPTPRNTNREIRGRANLRVKRAIEDALPPETRLKLEWEKLALERSKIAADIWFKRRENPRKSWWREVLSTPVTIAVMGGVLTLLTQIVLSQFNNAAQRSSDSTQLQGDLIKQFALAPDLVTAQSNLRFLVNAGLIPNYEAAIRQCLLNDTCIAPLVTATSSPLTIGPSGVTWVEAFTTSRNTADLTPTFRIGVEDFIAAIEEAGGTVTITATFRPPELAYLMHWAWRIAEEEYPANNVPATPGVEIDWAHRGADGQANLATAAEAATAMVEAFGLVTKPTLVSQHTQRNAIDMSISWSGTLRVRNAAGTLVTIDSQPRNGSNATLWEVGRTYGVIKLPTDPPHWSADGR